MSLNVALISLCRMSTDICKVFFKKSIFKWFYLAGHQSQPAYSLSVGELIKQNLLSVPCLPLFESLQCNKFIFKNVEKIFFYSQIK